MPRQSIMRGDGDFQDREFRLTVWVFVILSAIPGSTRLPSCSSLFSAYRAGRGARPTSYFRTSVRLNGERLMAAESRGVSLWKRHVPGRWHAICSSDSGHENLPLFLKSRVGRLFPCCGVRRELARELPVLKESSLPRRCTPRADSRHRTGCASARYAQSESHAAARPWAYS
jgi:hypothetical protein